MPVTEPLRREAVRERQRLAVERRRLKLAVGRDHRAFGGVERDARGLFVDRAAVVASHSNSSAA